MRSRRGARGHPGRGVAATRPLPWGCAGCRGFGKWPCWPLCCLHAHIQGGEGGCLGPLCSDQAAEELVLSGFHPEMLLKLAASFSYQAGNPLNSNKPSTGTPLYCSTFHLALNMNN